MLDARDARAGCTANRRRRVSATELRNGICESAAEWPSPARFTRPHSVCVMTADGHFAMPVDKDARCGLLIIERAKNGHNSTSPRDRDRAHRAPFIRISQPGQLSCCFALRIGDSDLPATL